VLNQKLGRNVTAFGREQPVQPPTRFRKCQ
jgi:hypothetical protein